MQFRTLRQHRVVIADGSTISTLLRATSERAVQQASTAESQIEGRWYANAGCIRHRAPMNFWGVEPKFSGRRSPCSGDYRLEVATLMPILTLV